MHGTCEQTANKWNGGGGNVRLFDSEVAGGGSAVQRLWSVEEDAHKLVIGDLDPAIVVPVDLSKGFCELFDHDAGPEVNRRIR